MHNKVLRHSQEAWGIDRGSWYDQSPLKSCYHDTNVAGKKINLIQKPDREKVDRAHFQTPPQGPQTDQCIPASVEPCARAT